MSLEKMLELLNLIADQLEDMSIERDALATILARAGYQREDVEHIWADAKSDPVERERARQAYAELRQNLEAEAVLEALSRRARSLDKSN